MDFIVCGDFNIDFMTINTHRTTLIELFNTFGGKHIVTEPTRVTIDTSSIIDNVFTNLKNCVSKVEECTFSDHNIVFF